MPIYEVMVYTVVKTRIRNVSARDPRHAVDQIWSDYSLSSALNRVHPPVDRGMYASQTSWVSADGVKFDATRADAPSDPDSALSGGSFVTDGNDEIQSAVDYDKVALVVRDGSIVEAMSLNRHLREVICLNEDAIPELVTEVRAGKTHLDRLQNRMRVLMVSPAAAQQAYKDQVTKQLGTEFQYVRPTGRVNPLQVEITGVDEWWPDMREILPRGPKQVTEVELTQQNDDSWALAANPGEAWKESMRIAFKRRISGRSGL